MKKESTKTSILLFIGHFLPGQKAGGPIQTIINTIITFSNTISFYVVCGDRDLGDKRPYPDIETNKWINKYGAHIYYTDMDSLNKKTIISLCNGFDKVISCGTYDKYSILLSYM